MPKMIFGDLPVGDLARPTRFYEATGCEKKCPGAQAVKSAVKFAPAVAAVAMAAVMSVLPSAHASETTAGRSNSEKAPGLQRDSMKRSAVARAGGLAIHYTIHGDLRSRRTPILVLHGAFMSGDAMNSFVSRLRMHRPVIVLDQRGHGRTGDAPGPITYEALADDAAAVLDAAGVRRADVFGYSMGGAAAFQMALRHPEKVGKLVSMSAYSRLDGMYPEVLAGIKEITPASFDNTPIQREYKRLAPRASDFPLLVEKLKVLDATAFRWDDAIRTLHHKTMIIMGDHDTTRPEHAVELFRMRGGADPAIAAQGYLSAPPPARLLILPGTGHIGVMTHATVISDFVINFLDDRSPPVPAGFF